MALPPLGSGSRVYSTPKPLGQSGQIRCQLRRDSTQIRVTTVRGEGASLWSPPLGGNMCWLAHGDYGEILPVGRTVRCSPGDTSPETKGPAGQPEHRP